MTSEVSLCKRVKYWRNHICSNKITSHNPSPPLYGYWRIGTCQDWGKHSTRDPPRLVRNEVDTRPGANQGRQGKRVSRPSDRDIRSNRSVVSVRSKEPSLPRKRVTGRLLSFSLGSSLPWLPYVLPRHTGSPTRTKTSTPTLPSPSPLGPSEGDDRTHDVRDPRLTGGPAGSQKSRRVVVPNHRNPDPCPSIHSSSPPPPPGSSPWLKSPFDGRTLGLRTLREAGRSWSSSYLRKVLYCLWTVIVVVFISRKGVNQNN